MEEDQLKFLKQRARLMHMRMAQIYEPTQKRREDISNLTMEMEGSTWHAIKQLEAENKTLKATQQLQSHAHAAGGGRDMQLGLQHVRSSATCRA